MTRLARSWSGPAWYAGALALSFVGYFVPRLDYVFDDALILVGFYAVGSVIVAALGGRQRREMLFVYSVYTILASIAFLLASHYGAPYGRTSPVYMVDRFYPRDDFGVYEWHVRPWIDAPSVPLFDGETNAPLHWYVNVFAQKVSLDISGRPQVMLGNALNIIMGSIAAALIIGAMNLSIRPSTRRRFTNGLPIAFVLLCPWLLASSIIAIREIWVYAVFALAVYGGLAIARWRPTSRLPALAALATACGLLCYLLRAEMMPAVVALVLFAGLTVRDKPMSRNNEFVLAGAVVATTLLLVVPLLVLKHGTLFHEVDARNVQYRVLGETLEEGQEGTVGDLVGGSRVLNGVLQTAWLPFQPWPRVRVPPGSTYQVGKLLMPIWVLACVAAVWTALRRRKRSDDLPEGSVWRRFRWLVVWMAAMQVLVGITSAESRHYFVILPVACCIIADVFQTSAQSEREVRASWRRSVAFALAALLAATILTLVAFGVDGMFPPAYEFR